MKYLYPLSQIFILIELFFKAGYNDIIYKLNQDPGNRPCKNELEPSGPFRKRSRANVIKTKARMNFIVQNKYLHSLYFRSL